MPVYLLGSRPVFPPGELAEKSGLLAIGGDLSKERLLKAYRHGIFPWYNPGEPILWWCPDPRLVLFPKRLHVSRRLKRTIRKGLFRVTFDMAFPQVIRYCAQIRIEQGQGTWLTEEMIRAYTHLHELGYVHSVETWIDDQLVGGLYGLCLGRVFFGESMFYKQTNASKIAFVALVKQLEDWDFALIDCQVVTSHLIRFGATPIPRKRFLRMLPKLINQSSKAPQGLWKCITPQG